MSRIFAVSATIENIALQHNRFMAEAREKEPEVVLIGDTHIQRLAQHEVSGFICCLILSVFPTFITQ